MIFITKGSAKEGFTGHETAVSAYSIHFDYSYLEREFRNLPFNNVFHVGLDSELLNLFNEINHAWLDSEDGYLLKVRACLILLLYRLLRFHSRQDSVQLIDKRIEKAKYYIIENYEKNISSALLAQLAGLNPDYFGTCFKNFTGINVKEYVNRVRIRKAQELLYTQNHTVREIASRCGFENIFYFSKVFKEIVGVPPSEYMLQTI